MIKNTYISVIFWVLYFLTIFAFSSTYTSIVKALYFSVTIVTFQATLVYINHLVLIPLLLEKKRIWAYVTAGVFLIAAMVMIRFQLPALDGENSLKLIKHRPRIFFFTFVLFLAYAAGNAFYFILDWFKNMQLKSEMKHLKTESELKYLRSRINPHFLFNTLNNIYSLCYLKDDSASDAVMKLSEMMRYVLHDGNASMIELQKEIRFVDNFIALQNLKKENLMRISFNVNGVNGEHKIVPLLLITFFENSFKHGDIEFNSDGWIKAELNVDELNKLSFSIINSKKSYKKNKYMESGTGLENVRKRLSIMYEGNYNLIVKDAPDQYSVELQLNLNGIKKDLL